MTRRQVIRLVVARETTDPRRSPPDRARPAGPPALPTPDVVHGAAHAPMRGPAHGRQGERGREAMMFLAFLFK